MKLKKVINMELLNTNPKLFLVYLFLSVSVAVLLVSCFLLFYRYYIVKHEVILEGSSEVVKMTLAQIHAYEES